MAKKVKFSTPLFVIASLGALVVFGAVYIIINFETSYNNISIPSQEESVERYYLNEDFNEDDPYITKRPGLKDILAGPIITELDPSLGDKYAPVVIVYFADFECGFCNKQEQVLKRILQNYKYKTKLIWKDYPANNIESKSFQAAIAARCADEQGRFWPYHDFLFENKNLDEKSFIEIAELIKLNINQFSDCLKTGRTKKFIYDNIEEANALAINGIPFMFVNDQEIIGSISYKDLEKIIKIELEKANDKKN